MSPTPEPSVLHRPAADEDEDLFDAVAADFLARFRAGEHPSVEAYAARHPEIADEIRELFPTMLTIERMKLEKEHSSGGRASLGARQIERLGDFRIIREIGRGGMGIVYEAEQESLERRVALKVLPPNALLDESHVARFHREARTAAALHHTNIVPVFGVGEAEGLHYYVMQLIDGEPLDQLLERNGRRPMEPRRAADIIRRVAQAVQYAHDHNTLHRDLKPANLLLDRSGEVWITDFGLAQALEREDTVTDHVAGTLRYMAPERFRGVADERTDQYALGITLYELVTGAKAFEGATTGELMQRIAQHDPAPARSLVPDLPRDLETIIEKAISKDPAHRYASCGDLAADLKNFLDGRPIVARRITAPERLWRWCRRNRALAAALASVALLLLIVASMATVGYFRARLHNRELQEALSKEQLARWRESIALADARQARDQERRAREAAEAITNLALEGLDRVFDEFAPTAPYTVTLSTAAADEENAETLLLPAQATVSPQVAAALSRLLPLYRRLADETAQDAHVRLRAASAQYRLGLIHRQLGRQEAALTAFWAARALLEALRQEEALPFDQLRLDLARVLNDLGDTERYSPQLFRERREAHEQALAWLSAVPVDALNDEERLELARTHYFLGQRDMTSFGPPRGGGPPRGDRNDRSRDDGDARSRRDRGGENSDRTVPRPPPSGVPPSSGPVGPPPPRAEAEPRDRPRPPSEGPSRTSDRDRGARAPGAPGFPAREEARRHLASAIQLLEEFPHGDRDTRVRLLMARCYRERAAIRSWEEVEQRRRDWETAVELLQELVREAPDMLDFRFELSETYADFEPRWWPEERLAEAETRLREALKLSEPLLSKAPDIPAYAAGQTQILLKLATVLRRTERPAEAEQRLTAAMALQDSLAARFPETPMHLIWKARISRSLADLLMEQERHDAAVSLLREAGAAIEPIVRSEDRRTNPAAAFAAFTASELYQKLAEALRDQGDLAGAEEARRKASELGPQSFFQRRPPPDVPEPPASPQAAPVQRRE